MFGLFAIAAPENRRLLGILGVLAALHGLAAILFVVDVRLPIALLIAVAAAAIAIERPLWGVALIIAGRLTSTGANAWVRIGKFNIDLFEPAVLLTMGALFVHAAVHRTPTWKETPWRTPVLVFLAFQTLSLAWTTNPTECIQEVMATMILLATTIAIRSVADSWDDVRKMLYVWIAASLFIAVASLIGLGTDEAEFEMAQGSRASGFGQHPNWFAMNLMFGVLLAFGLALAQSKPRARWLLFLAGLFIFLSQLRSGSRGGAGAVVIGGLVAGFLEPRIRRILLIAVPIVTVAVTAVIVFDVGDSANAFARIFVESEFGSSDVSMGRSVRISNWEVCIQMFFDTWGRGIGGGGYEDLLAHYDWWLYNSQYRYPHGIFWGMMAHYGAVGLLVYGWFILCVVKMTRDLNKWTRSVGEGLTEIRVAALCMAGSMVGYWAWSFVEFMYDDKPFWEFLGLYTVFWAIARARAQGESAAAP